MRLQQNTSGAWRNVMHFPVERTEEVKDAVHTLALAHRAAGGKPSWRIVDARDMAVLHHDILGAGGWHVPRWVPKGYEWLP